MEPTPRQVALIRASLPRLGAETDRLATRLCQCLQRRSPSLSARWANAAPSRSLRLTETVLEAAALIDRPEHARRAVSLSAHTLRGQGVTPCDYVAFHGAVTDAIAAQPGIDAETGAAWADGVGVILAHMLTEAHGPRRGPVSLAA